MSDIKSIVDQALLNASEAFRVYKKVSGKERATFLRFIGEEIENLGDELVKTTCFETNLPEARIIGERGRTVDQLNKFADLIEEGSWLEATIDIGNQERQPLPKPDIRRMLVPIGPVVVFGAGNFPLAFSVAGGDTASALAGGNPVIVKGHPAHPKTGELVASAIAEAVKKSGLPTGTFSFIQDSGYESGQLLVKHQLTRAVGFTGSQQGGIALMKLASEREEPIPVFAEMGSINPVVILKEALATDYESIATKLVASVNMGAGQFCTNPGLIITTESTGLDTFISELSKQVKAANGARMFSSTVLRSYRLNSDKMLSNSKVDLIKCASNTTDIDIANPLVATVSGSDFIENTDLHEEVFGPFSLLVVCKDDQQVYEVINSLKGQLTATLYGSKQELLVNTDLVDHLIEKCGRLLLNGVPTGVEVCAAMQHGGPFPAASDSRFTSVGVAAIKRFVRPVSYQDFLQELLPEELQDVNPLNIWRTVNNKLTKEPV